jgi:hypothetical protein
VALEDLGEVQAFHDAMGGDLLESFMGISVG